MVGWQISGQYLSQVHAESHVVMASVRHSQRISVAPVTPWVLAKKEWSSHRTGMAGLGEACSHIAALLFKLEANTEKAVMYFITMFPLFQNVEHRLQHCFRDKKKPTNIQLPCP